MEMLIVNEKTSWRRSSQVTNPIYDNNRLCERVLERSKNIRAHVAMTLFFFFLVQSPIPPIHIHPKC